MPRERNHELSIPCTYCGENTQSIEPISIKRSAAKRYYIKAKCIICGKIKSKFLNDAQRKQLSQEVLDIPIGTTVDNNITTKEGGILPLIPLIGAIAAGISALTGVAGTVASTVLNSKKNDEEQRHHREMESITKNAVGSGAGESHTVLPKGRTLDEIYSGGDISEQEAEQVVSILGGMGFTIF